MLAHPQRAEQLVEAVGVGLVIVCPHHAYEQALAETAGADEYLGIGLSFKLRQVYGLIDVVQAALHHRLEVGHSVWYLSNVAHVCNLLPANLRLSFE